jgi:hypothetical protein
MGMAPGNPLHLVLGTPKSYLPPRVSKFDELTSELKVLKLQGKIVELKKKLKSKKTMIQEVSSS